MNKIKFGTIFLLVVMLSACNLPLGNAGPSLDTAGTAAAQGTSVAQSIAQTLAAAESNTPEFTQTASLTPQPTASFTPEVPMVIVSSETNCRTGPGTAYDIVGVLKVGETAQVTGRDSSGGSWIIRNPDGAGDCWLWAQYATVTGNTQALPVIEVPPTPTPSAAFNASYDGMITCMGEYAFRIRINNPGSITWESVRVVVTDTVTATTKTHTADTFKARSGCPIDNELQNLETNEPGIVTTAIPGQFVYNPAGHAMTAEVTVCSANGLAGTCLTKSLAFTP